MEIRVVELAKYNQDEAMISEAPPLDQWAFFLLRADRYEAMRLRELLQGPEFQPDAAFQLAETL